MVRGCYRSAVDSYFRARDPSGPFLSSLKGRIALSQQDSIMQGTRYNVPLLNALVFYVGIEVSCTRLRNDLTKIVQSLLDMTGNHGLQLDMQSSLV